MKRLGFAAVVFLVLVTLASLFAEVIAPASYAQQFRDAPDAACSRQHLLGTDDLGRDRFSRLLYGTRVSLLLAPAAALLSSIVAGLVGGTAGFAGGWVEEFVMSATDLPERREWFAPIPAGSAIPISCSRRTPPAAPVCAFWFVICFPT